MRQQGQERSLITNILWRGAIIRMANNYEISRFAVFKDNAAEQEYFEKESKISLKYLRYVILLFGLIYVSLAISDYYYVTDTSLALKTVVLRFIILVLSVITFFIIDRLKNNVILYMVISAFEIFTIISYFLISYFINSQAFLAQCMTVIILLLALFLIPNRWINLIIVSLFCALSYLCLSFYYIENISLESFAEASVYIFLTVAFSCISTYRIQSNKRKQYAIQMQLELLTVTDKLTNIYNRAKFDLALEEWCKLSLRYNFPFSLIIFDLDDYKKVNDTFGHVAGDEVLVNVCEVVKESIRNGDIFARWGGEEFTILLPYTSLEQAYELAERLRKKIEHNVVICDHHITCSFGVTQFKEHDTMETFVKRADLLMYKAKKSGKNAVMMG